MAQESVARAIKELETAINNGRHHCDVHVEDLGESKEVSFYLDESAEHGGEPVGSIVITPPPGDD